MGQLRNRKIVAQVPQDFGQNQRPVAEKEKEMAAVDFNNVWTEGTRRALETYLEGGEHVARALLEVHERSTSWARDTVGAIVRNPKDGRQADSG
jgi:hypothetical protein